MPYRKFTVYVEGKKKYAIQNIKTGKITRFKSEEDREQAIRFREMYSHGFVPAYNRVSKRGRPHKVTGYKKR